MFITVTAAAAFNLYGIPWLVFTALHREFHYLKSRREKLYMHRLCMTLIINTLVTPWLFYFLTKLPNAKVFNDLVSLSIQQSKSFYLRQSLQFLVLIGYFQATTKQERVLKVFFDMLNVNGKYKFTHFLFDMGLRNAFVTTIFCLGLVFSLVDPMICGVVLAIFILAYSFDKFNLIFVYPLGFDSQITNR